MSSGKAKKTAPKKGKPHQAKNGRVFTPAGLVRPEVVRMLGKQHMAETKGATSGFLSVSTDAKGVATVTTIPQGVGLSREYAVSLLGTKPVKVMLIRDNGTQTAAVNTAFTTVNNADITQCVEWASFSGLFDEARVLEVKTCIIPSVQANGGVLSGNSLALIADCFDPADATASISVSDVMTQTRHLGPVGGFNVSGTTMAAGVTAPLVQSVTAHGTLTFTSGVLDPMLPVNAAGSMSQLVAGAWFPTSQTTAIAGSFKPYAEAYGANSVWCLRRFVYFHAEFRMRG